MNEIIQIPENYILSSSTDMHGTIVEVSAHFEEISGYSRDELIGQPHNMIRHPLVPKVVFEDFWRTLKEGQSWNGIVVNKAKDGREYWVMANVMPFTEGGVHKGYTSIRRPVTLKQIEAAKAIYKELENGKKVINHGVITSPLESKYNRSFWGRMSLSKKVMTTFGTVSILALSALGVDGYYNYKHEYNHQGDILSQNMVLDMNKTVDAALNSAKAMASSQSFDPILIDSLVQNDRNIAIPHLAELYEKNAKLYPDKKLKIHLHTPEAKSFIRSWKLNKYGDDLSGFRFTINDVIKNKQPIGGLEMGKAGLTARGLSPMYSSEGKYVGSIEVIYPMKEITDIHEHEHNQFLVMMKNEFTKVKNDSGSIDLAGKYKIVGEKNYSASAVDAIKSIDVNKLISQGWVLNGNKFVSAAPIKSVTGEAVGYQVIFTDAKPFNVEMAAVKDQFIFMLATVIGIILLMIGAVMTMMYQSVLRPVDRLKDVIEQVVETGRFESRLSVYDSNSEVIKISKAFNSLMDSLQLSISSSANMMMGLSQGKFDGRQKVDQSGELENLRTVGNASADRIESTMSLLKESMDNLANSEFKKFIAVPEDITGGYKEMLEKSQQTANDLANSVDQINIVANHLAKGDFSGRLTVELSGEMKLLKDNLNTSLENIDSALGEVGRSLSALSKGDLTARVEGDFHGQLAAMQSVINNSLGNLGSLIIEMGQHVESVSSSSEKISADNQTLSGRAQEQAAMLEETAATMEEIASIVQSSSDNAVHASSLTQKVNGQSQEGMAVMNKTMTTLEGVQSETATIKEIITLIDGIAFQTNLLALNAAVEAARAGEHGRGFAVVAGEVRTLAGRSSDAADQIKELIEQITAKISEGVAQAKESNDKLSEVAVAIQDVDSLVSEISQSSQEQSSGIAQVNDAISNIDSNTQANAAMAEEATRLSEDLQKVAQELKNSSSSFNVDPDLLSMGTTVKIGTFDFAKARRAHRGWRSHMSGSIYTGADVDDTAIATDHHACELGKWMDSHREEYSSNPTYRALDEKHIELHKGIANYLDKSSGRPMSNEEIEKLDGISNEIIALITKLETEVGG